ncbi:MAG TPA: hypothetical protein VLC49_09115 [Solirubrobacteraceae bacterium]|nr:hypothetical protein [Solirubrobacteraceae bacterium]
MLVAVGVMVPAAVARPGGMIQTGRNGVTALGSWHVSTHSTFPAAVRALGAASAVHVHSHGNSCTGAATWRKFGLRIVFTSFSVDPYCAAVRAQTGTISGAAGRRHWQTTRGLRVGDSLGTLKRLYPRAIKGHGGWAIVYSRHSVIAEGSRLDIVTAQVKGNRVSAFSLWIGGAGD